MTEKVELPPVIDLGFIDVEPVHDERTAELASQKVEEKVWAAIAAWNERKGEK